MDMMPRITRFVAPACASLLLAACGSLPSNLWPFGGDTQQDRSQAPTGATAYRCDAGKRLFVRLLDDGAAAWVILPEREFRLDRTASASGTRYGNGSAVLDLDGRGATLSDGTAVTHSGCKTTGG